MSNTSTKHITLVATDAMIQQYLPDAATSNGPRPPGVRWADFAVDRDRCETKLGRFLADHITTTRRDDDASHVWIVAPVTDAGAALQHLCKAYADRNDYQVLSEAEFNARVQKLRAALDAAEARVRTFGQCEFDLRQVQYEWPVFGSHAGGIRDGVDTPEKFLDYCGRAIRQTRGVIIRAGLSCARPEESLLRTMGDHSTGLLLLAEYERQVHAASASR